MIGATVRKPKSVRKQFPNAIRLTLPHGKHAKHILATKSPEELALRIDKMKEASVACA